MASDEICGRCGLEFLNFEDCPRCEAVDRTIEEGIRAGLDPQGLVFAVAELGFKEDVAAAFVQDRVFVINHEED